jgi:hypothetical protein
MLAPSGLPFSPKILGVPMKAMILKGISGFAGKIRGAKVLRIA